MKLLLFVMLSVGLAAQASAQVGPEGPQLARARGNAAKRFAEVERLLADGKPQPAADGLRKLITEAGDDLISRDGRHFRPVRVAARDVLKRMPANEQRAWRERSDALAAERLARAVAARDSAALEAVADDYPLSGSSGPALQLWGELAFGRGEFRSAETVWRRGGDATPLQAARLTLSVSMQGDVARAQQLLTQFRAAHPKAAGPLAGRVGVYADTLTELLAAPPVVPPPASGDAEWATFGGNAARTAHAARPLARYWPARPSWVLGLPGPADPPPDGLVPTRQLTRFPVVIGEVGFVADSRSVVAFDLRRGVQLDSYQHPKAADESALAGEALLTAVPGRNLLFARLGPAEVAPPPPMGSAVLGCFEVTEGKLNLAYTLKPPVAAGVAAAWEAAPVWHDGQIFAAFVRESGNRLISAIACYGDRGGEPVWVADVAEAGVGTRVERRLRPEPLTLGGGRVIYCTHAGFVVALAQSSGKPVWAQAYPPAARPTPEFRALAPAIFEGGRVFVAPTDTDRLMALDAVSGELLWEVKGTQTEQLLGVSDGHLLASVAAPVRGLRGYDLASGSTRAPAGWAVADDPQLTGFGSGLVASGALVWPTRAGVFFVRPSDGLPLAARLNGPHGNLALAGGVLLVATPTEVWGYLREPEIPAFPAPTPKPRGQSIAELLVTQSAGGGPGPLAAFRRHHRLSAADDEIVVRTPSGVPARLGSLLTRHFVPGATPRSPREPPEAATESATPLGDDVRVAKAVRLPSRACLPLLPFVGRAGLPGLTPTGAWAPLLLVADGQNVHALVPEQPQPLWSWQIPPGTRLTHAAADGGRLILAGPRDLLSLAPDSGRVVWSYRHPDELPELGEVQAIGSRLTARVGSAQRICLDPRDGDILWGRDEQGRPRLGADAPAQELFASPLTAVGTGWVGQIAPGRCVVMTRETGEWWAESATYPNPWPGQAVQLGPDRVAFAAGPGEVRAGDLPSAPGTMRPVWDWQAGTESSLTGRMPHLALARAGLIVAVERNVATELMMLMPKSGQPAWPQGLRLPPGSPDLNALAEDHERVYVPVGDTLHAVRFSDGRIAWSAHLPTRLGVAAGTKISLSMGERGLAVAVPVAGEDPFRLRALVVGLVTNRFVATLLAQADALSGVGVEVLILDPATGERRAGVRVAGGLAACELTGPHPVIVTPGTAHWLR